MFPIVFMNLLGGIVSGIWLAILGEWAVIGAGLLAAIGGTLPISFALMPVMLLALPMAKLVERGRLGLGMIFAIPVSVYTIFIMSAWCYLVFLAAFRVADERHAIPVLLWSYGAATGPWTYMASKEAQGGDGGSSAVSVFFITFGYLIMIASRLILGASFQACITAFAVVMLLLFAYQIAYGFLTMKSGSMS